MATNPCGDQTRSYLTWLWRASILALHHWPHRYGTVPLRHMTRQTKNWAWILLGNTLLLPGHFLKCFTLLLPRHFLKCLTSCGTNLARPYLLLMCSVSSSLRFFPQGLNSPAPVWASACTMHSDTLTAHMSRAKSFRRSYKRSWPIVSRP